MESYLAELCLELQHDPADQFVQGKMKSVQHALKFARMHMDARKNGSVYYRALQTPVIEATDRPCKRNA